MTAGVSLIALLACWFDLKQGRSRRWQEAVSNVSIFLIGQIIGVLFLNGLQIWLVTRAKPLWAPLPRDIATYLLTILAIDLIFYWRHRVEHHLPILWAEHCVHHNGHELNFSTSLRLPWFNPFNGILAIPLVWIGFPIDYIFGAIALNLFYQYFIHNEVIGRLGFLEYIFATPSNHRVHHGQNAEYINKNFGGIFIFWDRLFGTYVPETLTPRYSGEQSTSDLNPVAVNVNPLIRFFRKSP